MLEHRPLGLEGVDELLIEDMTMLGKHQHDLSRLPDGRGWLLVELGGDTKDEADDKARALQRDLERAGGGLRGVKIYDDKQGEEHVWGVREAGLGATAFLPGQPDTHEGWEDSAVPPERLGDYLRALTELTGRYGYRSALYGHYGQGCVHARFNFDLVTSRGHRERSAASSTRRPTSSSRSAARSPASTATVSRAPSCCRRCSATSS